MSTLLIRMKREVLHVLPPALFFFCAFQLIALTQALTLQEFGIPIYSFIKITIGALLAGKVVLIADHLPFMNRFPDRSLIWNVVWKTLIYILAATLVRYLEQLVHASIDQGGIAAGHAAVMGSIIWSRYWAVQIWIAVLFFGYTLLRELLRALGREHILRMIFVSPH